MVDSLDAPMTCPPRGMRRRARPLTGDQKLREAFWPRPPVIPQSRPDVARKGRTWIALFDDAPLAILNPDPIWSEITASVRRLVRNYGHR
jgi:hypothetical protein